MKRYVGSFGLLGFLVVLSMGILGEAPLDQVLWKSMVWGATFTLLGLVLGLVVRSILAENEFTAQLEESGVSAARAREIDEEVGRKAQQLIRREIKKSPILVEKVKESAEKADAPDHREDTV